MDVNTIDVMDEGMRCLVENMGVIKAEKFISVMLREQFDYTKWHQRFVDRMTKEAFDQLVEQSEKEVSFEGNPSAIV